MLDLFDSNDIIIVNGLTLNLDFRLSCKGKDIIYIAQSQICTEKSGLLKEDTYFGQTVTSMHVRMHGHMNKCIIDDSLAFE